MSDLRRMLSSSNALFVFEAAARSGSFTRAAAELNVTQPAVSRIIARFEEYLGTRLFDRAIGGAVLTEEGELLYRRIAEGFRSIEAGFRDLEQRRGGAETVTLSVSSAFTTHWLMPRIDRFQWRFPTVDLRFQLIAGSLRGPVENVDLGMRFVAAADAGAPAAFVMREVMLPVCSPAYHGGGSGDDGNTLIQLTDAPGDWPDRYPPFETGRRGPTRTIAFSDYSLVVQAALLGQGIAFGWLTVVAHALIAGALVPASDRPTLGARVCELIAPRNRPPRPVVEAIRAWIVAELRADLATLEERHPGLGLVAAAYGDRPRAD
jgi:DNA-binding transcriptional LysR family regulator